MSLVTREAEILRIVDGQDIAKWREFGTEFMAAASTPVLEQMHLDIEAMLQERDRERQAMFAPPKIAGAKL